MEGKIRGKRNKRMRMFIGISKTPLIVKKNHRKHSLKTREVGKNLKLRWTLFFYLILNRILILNSVKY